MNGERVACGIYETRDEVCAEHAGTFGPGFTHENCADFPDNPWITVVRNGTCAFTFARADSGSMNDLPFLNEDYLT